MVSLFVWGSLAFGSPELDVERGWVDMTYERYPDARSKALEVLTDDADHAGARELYRAASEASGLGHRLTAELGDADPDAAWASAHAALQQAARSRDVGRAKTAARDLADQFSDHPELLGPLWGDQPELVAIGARYARRWSRKRALGDTDPVVMHRLLRLVRAHPVEASVIDQILGRPAPRLLVEQALQERGEPIGPTDSPLGRVRQTQLAYAMLDEEQPVPPLLPTSERMALVTELAGLYEQTNRAKDAAEMFQKLRGALRDPAIPLGEARAWLAFEQPIPAVQAATESLYAATGPLPTDLGVRDEALRRRAVADALAVRAAAREQLGQPRRALVDLALSTLVADALMDDALSERLSETTNLMLAPVARRYPSSGTGWQHALAAASKATDPDTKRDHLENAQFLAVAYTRGGKRVKNQAALYRGVLAELLLASLEMPESDPRETRATLVIASTWLRAGNADVWNRRGAAHEAVGDIDAAFESYAVAAELGASDAPVSLARTYRGPGQMERVAGSMGAVVSLPAAVVGEWGMPTVGKPFPDLRFDTDRGARQLGRLQGRYLLVTLYTGSCEDCVSRLPRLGALAQEWRDEGRDTLSIGICLDEDPANLERVIEVGAPWGALVHGPEIGPQLGVDSFPVSFVVDPQGVTRMVALSGVTPDEVEKAARELVDDGSAAAER